MVIPSIALVVLLPDETTRAIGNTPPSAVGWMPRRSTSTSHAQMWPSLKAVTGFVRCLSFSSGFLSGGCQAPSFLLVFMQILADLRNKDVDDDDVFFLSLLNFLPLQTKHRCKCVNIARAPLQKSATCQAHVCCNNIYGSADFRQLLCV